MILRLKVLHRTNKQNSSKLPCEWRNVSYKAFLFHVSRHAFFSNLRSTKARMQPRPHPMTVYIQSLVAPQPFQESCRALMISWFVNFEAFFNFWRAWRLDSRHSSRRSSAAGTVAKWPAGPGPGVGVLVPFGYCIKATDVWKLPY